MSDDDDITLVGSNWGELGGEPSEPERPAGEPPPPDAPRPAGEPTSPDVSRPGGEPPPAGGPRPAGEPLESVRPAGGQAVWPSDVEGLAAEPPAGRAEDRSWGLSWAGTDDYLRATPPAPTRRRPAGGTRRTRAERRRQVRRRRAVALLVLALVLVALVVIVLRACGGGDPFVGTWAKSGSGTVVISQSDDGRYVVALTAKSTRPGVRKGDRLTVTRRVNGKKRVIWFTPGAEGGTLEEHFPDGTTTVLTRQ